MPNLAKIYVCLTCSFVGSLAGLEVGIRYTDGFEWLNVDRRPQAGRSRFCFIFACVFLWLLGSRIQPASRARTDRCVNLYHVRAFKICKNRLTHRFRWMQNECGLSGSFLPPRHLSVRIDDILPHRIQITRSPVFCFLHRRQCVRLNANSFEAWAFCDIRMGV